MVCEEKRDRIADTVMRAAVEVGRDLFSTPIESKLSGLFKKILEGHTAILLKRFSDAKPPFLHVLHGDRKCVPFHSALFFGL